MIACRTASRLGYGGGPGIRFSPSGFLEPEVLKEGVGDHGHQGMTMQRGP